MEKFVPTPNRLDPYFAMLCCLIHNANVAKKSDARKPEDFLLYYDPFEEDITPEELIRRISLRG